MSTLESSNNVVKKNAYFPPETGDDGKGMSNVSYDLE